MKRCDDRECAFQRGQQQRKPPGRNQNQATERNRTDEIEHRIVSTFRKPIPPIKGFIQRSEQQQDKKAAQQSLRNSSPVHVYSLLKVRALNRSRPLYLARRWKSWHTS